MNITSFNQRWQDTSVPSLSNIKREWYCIDLKNKIIGRSAVLIANLLRGKNKNYFTYNSDLGNFVVLLNAAYIKFKGKNKLKNKCYYDHSGYPGGLKVRDTATMLREYPKELVFRIIKGMIPHNNLGRKQIKRLFIFTTSKHDLKAQEKNFINLE